MTKDRRQKSEVRGQSTDYERRNAWVRLNGLVAGAFMLIALSLLVIPGMASANLSINANHDHMTIDFFYHGSSVGVSGALAPGTDLVVKIASPDGHEALKKKGKMAGVVWMNVGDLKFERAPGLYLLKSSKPIDQILSPEERTKHVLGYQALEGHMDISPVSGPKEKSEWFGEFVKFKASAKLYSVSDGDVSFTKNGEGQDYSSHLDWPYQAPAGKYTVTVYAVKDKKVVETAQAEVLVEQVGAVKTLADMAKDNGAMYGVLSIIAAIGAGFGVGMVFRKGGGSH
ncbi:MAG: hypothetical protein HGA78_09355 [Nitrospirales bacterium]|nr:hypothetical protein [Nitrospirales bacterium]